MVVILLHLNLPQILNENPPAKHAHTLREQPRTETAEIYLNELTPYNK